MSNQFSATASDRRKQHSLQQSLKQLLQFGRKAIAFMVHRPQVSAQPPVTLPEHRYSAKAALYSYLPADEEQRDWLDRLYKR